MARTHRKKKLMIGNRKITTYLPLPDSTDLLKKKDFEGLQERMKTDGVLLLRGVIPKKVALQARSTLLEHVSQKGGLDLETGELDDAIIRKEGERKRVDGWTVDAQTGGVVGERDDDVEGWEQIGNSKDITKVYNGPYLQKLFSKLFGPASRMQPHNTWIRLKGKGDVTIEHADYYYFKRNTDMLNLAKPEAVADACLFCEEAVAGERAVCTRCHCSAHLNCIDAEALQDVEPNWHCISCSDAPIETYTCWCSLSDVDVKDSTLGFVLGTHTLSGFDRPQKNKQTPLGYESVRRKLKWSLPATPLEPGDIFVFNIKTIHAATKNETNSFRISMDTRLHGQ